MHLAAVLLRPTQPSWSPAIWPEPPFPPGCPFSTCSSDKLCALLFLQNALWWNTPGLCYVLHSLSEFYLAEGPVKRLLSHGTFLNPPAASPCFKPPAAPRSTLQSKGVIRSLITQTKLLPTIKRIKQRERNRETHQMAYAVLWIKTWVRARRSDLREIREQWPINTSVSGKRGHQRYPGGLVWVTEWINQEKKTGRGDNWERKLKVRF